MENKKYCCNLIFSDKPLKKLYRFKNEFQIYPLPIEYCLDYNDSTHFPILLEYVIDLSEKLPINYEGLEEIEDILSESTLQNNKLNLIIRVLSCVTNHFFFIYDIEQGWFMPIDKSISREEYNSIESKWGFNFYHKVGLFKRLQINQFTNVNIENITKIKHSEYFQFPNFEPNDGEITISKYTDAFFESFFNLQKEEKKYVYSSITLIYNGKSIKDKMRSLAFISFMSSIETMTSFHFKKNKEEIHLECDSCKKIKSSPYECPKCKSPIWGITQQIKLYLKEFLTTDEKANSIINKLYGIRSKITHSGELLLGDVYTSWSEGIKKEEENLYLISVMQYSKLSLVNWLLKKEK